MKVFFILDSCDNGGSLTEGGHFQDSQARKISFAILRFFSGSKHFLDAYIAKTWCRTQANMSPLNQKSGELPEGRCRVTTFVEMVFPDQANHYGTLYGGNALGILGKAAFVTATRFARLSVVMAASERVEFHTPVRLGQMLELTGRVVRVGRSSMTVEVEGVAETLPGGARTPALRGHFEMVAVDDAGRPRAILLEGEAPDALS